MTDTWTPASIRAHRTEADGSIEIRTNDTMISLTAAEAVGLAQWILSTPTEEPITDRSWDGFLGGLGKRALTTLGKLGIQTQEHFNRLSLAELRAVKGAGPTTIAEIEKRAKAFEFAFVNGQK